MTLNQPMMQIEPGRGMCHAIKLINPLFIQLNCLFMPDLSYTVAIPRQRLHTHQICHKQVVMASGPASRVVDHWDIWPGAPYERHEILHYLRGREENEHRTNIWRDSAEHPFLCYEYFVTHGHDQLRQMSIKDAEKFCNKSVPIYIYEASSSPHYQLSLLYIALHNYIYRKWFRPYQSEIEFNRFLTKVAIVNSIGMKTTTHFVIDHVLFLHKGIVEQIKSAQDKAKNAFRSLSEAYTIQNPESFVLQPLFQAMAIIILSDDYDHTTPDIRQIPVLIVLTDVTDGLSAPITFEPILDRITSVIQDNAIQTTLETAITFILDLENREVAAFGVRPNPTIYAKDWTMLSRHSIKTLRISDLLGWEGEPLTGPSSTWVNRELYPEWSGQGADIDADLMLHRESLKFQRCLEGS
jgi:hypothetical protein